jgi:hypothetical protein
MPLTRVEIEEIGPGKWVAEVEGGGTSAVRRNVRGSSFDEIILAVVDAHNELVPAPKAKPAAAGAMVVGSVPTGTMGADVLDAIESGKPLPTTASARAAAESEALQREVDALPALNELRDQAQALGIEVDLRWRERRLMDEIEAAKARQERGE